MKNEGCSKRILFLFCIFLYPVMFRKLTALSYIYQYGIPLAYIALNFEVVRKISKKQVFIIGGLVILIYLSLLYPTLHGTYDYSYLKVSTFVFRKLLVYVFLGIVLLKEYGKNMSVEYFIYYYIMVHAIYVCGTLILVLVPGFKTIWFSVFSEVVETGTLLESFGYTFRIGWQGFAGYRMTLHCTWCCILLFYMFFECKEQYRIKESVFFILFALCFLGNMFYGRSGLVLSILIALCAVILWNKKYFYRILQMGCAFVLFAIIIYLLRNKPIVSDWYTWMSKPLINLVTEGTFNNYSVNRINEMVFMPEWKTILKGDGMFMENGHYYMRTDSGFMRNILFWGIGGAFVSYLITWISLWDLKRYSWFVCICMIMTFAIFEYKGDVYYEYIAFALAISFVENFSIKRDKNGEE